ncbi:MULTISPECIES: chemotaxis protein [unclassified Bradyrhizobium]|uniref:chemotaxis protein n=1 Tax=unclassified Bradyrhizobium TaxID=2631580 RepID=UPI0028EA579A|nr:MULTISPECIES: chemotaxis protein [unclassified Bradyrhizobium]
MSVTDMMTDASAAAVTAIADVSSRIEEAFAEVGDRLGRSHAVFKELEGGLSVLSRELSGGRIEGASQALQDIADRLNAVADALPAEAALLANIGEEAKQASAVLKLLSGHIQTITIVARSARIEAASFDGERQSFLDFTREAFELGQSVQCSVEACARDGIQLAKAVEAALARQRDFENLYRSELQSVAAGLVAARSELAAQQVNGARLTEMAAMAASRIASAIAEAVMALQSGDATRQRLEHICQGLGHTAQHAPPIVPEPLGPAGSATWLIGQLQAEQLRDTKRAFDLDLARTVSALSAIMCDAEGLVAQSRAIYGGEADEPSSFLSTVKQRLSQASSLIAACEQSGGSVDEALSVVTETVARFREAISGLSDAVDDIILIGMNASLRAARAGVKGNAFVVIANELKASADQMSAGAMRLKPVLDRIESFVGELRERRDQGDAAELARLEPAVLSALHEVEAGNAQLAGLMTRLARESAAFDELLSRARDRITALDQASARLPGVAATIAAQNSVPAQVALTTADQPLLDELFARYTMEREREVHRDLLQRFGLASAMPAPAAPVEEDDGVLLF